MELGAIYLCLCVFPQGEWREETRRTMKGLEEESLSGGFEEEERGDLPEAKLKKKGGGVGLVFFICIL